MRNECEAGCLRLAFSCTVDPVADGLLGVLRIDVYIAKMLCHIFKHPKASIAVFPVAENGLDIGMHLGIQLVALEGQVVSIVRHWSV